MYGWRLSGITTTNEDSREKITKKKEKREREPQPTHHPTPTPPFPFLLSNTQGRPMYIYIHNTLGQCYSCLFTFVKARERR